jgi:hypothetical protein
MRGLLTEYGIILPKGVHAFRKLMVGKLEAEQAQLTPLSQELFDHLFDEFIKLEDELAYYEDKHNFDAVCKAIIMAITALSARRLTSRPQVHT